MISRSIFSEYSRIDIFTVAQQEIELIEHYFILNTM